MNDKRFESWWTSNPARVALNPAAKEVARKVWNAAQEDFVSQLRSRPLQPLVASSKLGVPDGEDDDTIPLAQPRTGNKGTPC